MTGGVMKWIQSLGLTGKTLDVGSLNVCGCVRRFFKDYTGLDMRPGRNVDIVANAHAIPFPDETFDTVVCLEMLEHDSAPWLTLPELARVTKPGGIVAVTARGIHHPKHNFPSDYWRFTVEGLRVLLGDVAGLEVLSGFEPPTERGVFGHGRRPGK